MNEPVNIQMTKRGSPHVIEIFTDPDICMQWEEAAVRIMTGDPAVAGQIVIAGQETPDTRICLKGDHGLFDGALLKSAGLLQPVN